MRIGIYTLLLMLVGCASAPQRVLTNRHTLGSGDRLRIVITNRESPEFYQAVDTSGDISMPLAGKLHVSGMTLEEAAKGIEDAYWLSGCWRERIRVSVSKL